MQWQILRAWTWHFASRVLACCVLACVFASHALADTTSEPDVVDGRVPIDSAAVHDVFDPLPGISARGGASWKAAVVTLPDPVESRLARSFDILIATLVRNFQFNDYVLQGHAMPWPQDDGKDGAPSSTAFRDIPGVLVFRRDAWREQGVQGSGTRYFVLYLVGESPTFGVQRLAFCRAVRQAAALNAGGDAPPRSAVSGGPDGDANAANDRRAVTVLGPTFSGSLASIATVAKQAGALGARMTGGGFGGSSIALVAKDPVEALGAAVLGTFAERGFKEPVIRTMLPSRGASRDR